MGKHRVAGGRSSRPHPAVWVGGGLSLLGALLVRLRAGSPLPLLHLLGTATRLPPLWLMGVLWSAGFFLFGCAAGEMLVCRAPGSRAAWRGRGFPYGLISYILALAWYPLLFSASWLWFSLLCQAAATAAALCCALCWIRVRGRLALLLLPWVGWQVFLCGAELAVLLTR